MPALPPTTYYYRLKDASLTPELETNWTEDADGTFTGTAGETYQFVCVGPSLVGEAVNDTTPTVVLSAINVTFGTAVTVSPTYGGTNRAYSLSGPDWLSINAGTGQITGTAPSDEINTTYTVTVSNAAGSVSATASVAVTVDAPPELNALTAATVTIPGASLVARPFANTARAAYLQDRFAQMGYTGTLSNSALGNQSMAAGLTHWESVSGAYGPTTFAIVDSRGNDVSPNRPYATDANAGAFAGDPLASPFATAWAAFYNGVADVVGSLRVGNITHRNYTTSPAVDPHDASTYANGSMPYNENIVEPLIQSLSPNSWDSVAGAPKLDIKSFTELTPWITTSEDGIHWLLDIEHGYPEWLLWKTAREFYTSPADVAGKTFILNTVRPESSTRDDIVGTTNGNVMNSLVVLQTSIRTLTGEHIPRLAAWTEGGTPPSINNPVPEVAGVTDPDLQEIAARTTPTFASDATLLNPTRSTYFRVVIDNLPPGQTGSMRILARRVGVSTQRVGEYSINGVVAGDIDASDASTRHELIVPTWTADANGRVTIEVLPKAGSILGYFNCAKIICDA